MISSTLLVLTLFSTMAYNPTTPPPPAAVEDAQNIICDVVSFKSVGLPEYDGKYALVIDGLFSPDECTWLLQQAVESTKSAETQTGNNEVDSDNPSPAQNPWHVAQLNGGRIGHQYTNTDVRNSSRIIVDSHSMAEWILAKLRPHLQDIELIKGADMHKLVNGREWNEVFKALNGTPNEGERANTRLRTRKHEPAARLTRLNERLRFLKYIPGQFFKPHFDGCYHTDDKSEMSYMTLQIYLNGPAPSPEDGLKFVDPEQTSHASEPLKGGATRFFSRKVFRSQASKQTKFDVEPKLGRVLVFEQDDMIHSGETIDSGVKYTMRTDFMYALERET